MFFSFTINLYDDTEIQDVDVERLLEIGTNVVRFKTYHSTTLDNVKMIKKFGKAASFLAAKYGLYEWPYSTSIELKTSMVQSGILEENNSEEQVSEIWIEENSEVILTNEVSQFDKCNKSQIFVDDPYLISDVTVGMEINIDRDEIIMVCTDKHEKSVQCTVTKGGYLQNFAHVFMRGAILTRPSISKTDLHMIKFALEYQIDMLIVNYPRNVETITNIKKTIGPKHKRPLIIAGISTQEGYMNIDEIVKAGKPFYVSGWIFNEILTTGIASTREISDVTNAILKGATGLCLHETTDMNNVFEAIKSLNNLCCNVEPLCTDKSEFWDLMSRTKMPLNAAEACAMSCVVAANQTKAHFIIVPTVSGRTVALLSLFRPNSSVITVSTTTRTVRRLKAIRSVIPLLYKGAPCRTWSDTVQNRINFALQYAIANRWISFKDYYITLEKGSEGSIFCDTVRVCKVTVSKKTRTHETDSEEDNNRGGSGATRFETIQSCIGYAHKQAIDEHCILKGDTEKTDQSEAGKIIQFKLEKVIKAKQYDAMELPGQQLAAANASTPLDHVLNLDIKAPAACTRLTGIIASMGKSTYDVEILEKMIAAGMNIALLNMNFGPREEHTECIKMLRIAAKNYSIKMGKNYPMSIAMRLSGRKIRTGRLAESYGESVELKTGEVVRLTTDETYKDRCSTYTVYVDFMYFAEQMKKGDLILLDNETILLKVEMISTTTLTCRIERGGFLGSFKDVFVPNVVLNMPNYTEKDKLDIEMAIQNQIDIIVASFVNSASCVLELKAILGEKGKKLAVVANIQTIEGFRNFDAILQVADGIMISRQELGSDISPNKLVIAQKNMIARANRVNAPIAVSAHILSSMRDKKIPLRAELLDIANCIIDGVDSLVLCAVTSVGLYPVDTVAAMCATCKEAESCIWTKQTPLPCDQATGAAMAGVLAAQRSIAAAIIVVTTSGKSAQTVAKFKPRCPIIAVTRYGLVARQLHLWRGIVPLIYEDEPETDWASDLEKRVNFAIKWSIERGFVRIGDPMVIISGWRQGSGYTNTMRVIYASADAVTVL
ncbi:hypothetical protein HW555_012617 [Spodoptera exigua]|uniref:Pyruvate kinase n=1 Tax=Spodoptera exigua TaxID=7107 RepID=A0A835G756_SPOEX|nr:hypothetical protein HW555_012617 [Spodoptera exigua]